MPRAFLDHNKPDALLAEIGLDASGLAKALSRLLNDEPEFPPVVPVAPRGDVLECDGTLSLGQLGHLARFASRRLKCQVAWLVVRWISQVD